MWSMCRYTLKWKRINLVFETYFSKIIRKVLNCIRDVKEYNIVKTESCWKWKRACFIVSMNFIFIVNILCKEFVNINHVSSSDYRIIMRTQKFIE